MTASLPKEVLRPLKGTALFYPCCGRDLSLPLSLFVPSVADFYFVDIRRPPRLTPPGCILQSRGRGEPDSYSHEATSAPIRLHRVQALAQDFLAELPPLGVFFFRGDHPVNGEGSSGVLWLGGELFPRILSRLVPGGLVVTDGSNPGPRGPHQLSRFYNDREVGSGALAQVQPFSYLSRQFECVGYVGERYGPTLVWRAA